MLCVRDLLALWKAIANKMKHTNVVFVILGEPYHFQLEVINFHFRSYS